MIPREAVEARPRSTVEILDDAWRICFAEPLLLLAITFLFYLPAATCLVVLIVQPIPETGTWRLIFPATTAFLLLLTGLASGACQEAFHSWSEDYDIGFGECLKAAGLRAVYHIASQGLSLVGPMAVLAFLLSPRLGTGARIVGLLAFGVLATVISLFSLTRHPSFSAGKPRFGRAIRYALRVSGQALDRALFLVTIRGTLLLFAVVNLHLFGNFALWAAESFGGFDVAYAGVLCSFDNAAYTLAVALLAWSLLSPFFEACNYLFFVDARTRFEGLDLWNRVQDHFPVGAPNVKAKEHHQSLATVAVLLVAFCLAMTSSVASADQPLPEVRSARLEVQTIREEVQVANPYPGGRVWQARLEELGKRLNESTGEAGGFRWFQSAVSDFPHLNQTQAVAFLDDLDNRLALVEDSLARPRHVGNADAPSADQIKSLIPPDKRTNAKRNAEKTPESKQKKDQPPPVEDDNPAGGFNPVKPAGPPIVPPVALGGAANALLIVLIGLIAAALVAGLAFILYSYFKDRPKAAPRQAGALAPKADDPLEDPAKQDPTKLWRQADDRARAGDYLGAVRIIYLAVLALLHQGGFIRYERTRTNGEYVDQLQPRTILQGPFKGLTLVFEVKWYGERACEPEDYRRCRELAEDIRVGSRQPQTNQPLA